MKEKIIQDNIFDNINEGDLVKKEEKGKALTVYRHVKENDTRGQMITLNRVPGYLANDPSYKDYVIEGDYITTELTGKEFLLLRGPKDGVWALTEKWKKPHGMWISSIYLWRHNIKPSKDIASWKWENKLNAVYITGKTDVNPDNFDYGLDWSIKNINNGTVWSSLDDKKKSNIF